MGTIAIEPKQQDQIAYTKFKRSPSRVHYAAGFHKMQAKQTGQTNGKPRDGQQTQDMEQDDRQKSKDGLPAQAQEKADYKGLHRHVQETEPCRLQDQSNRKLKAQHKGREGFGKQ